MNLNESDPNAQRDKHSSATARRGNFHFQRTKWTYIQNIIAAPIFWRREHWFLAGIVVSVIVMAGAVLPNWAAAMRETNAALPRTTLDVPLPALSPDDSALSAAIDAANSDPLVDDTGWQVVNVRSGQTLGDIFQQQGLGAADLAHLLDDRNNASALRNIHPGEEFAFLRNGDGSLRALRFDRDEHTRVIASFAGRRRTTVEDGAVKDDPGLPAGGRVL